MDSSKNAIRREMRRRRQALTPAAVDAAASAVVERVRTFVPYRKACTVLAYVATDGEFPTASLIRLAFDDGKRVFLPCVEANEMVFAEHRPGAPLPAGRFGIPEPVGAPLVIEPHVRVIAFVPVVAWDDAAVRLGRGGGYYDRALSQVIGVASIVGLAFECQRYAALPAEPSDVRLDAVVTERALWRCGDGHSLAPIRKEDTSPNGTPVDDTGHCRSGGRRARLDVGVAAAPTGATASAGDPGNGGSRAPGGTH